MQSFCLALSLFTLSACEHGDNLYWPSPSDGLDKDDASLPDGGDADAGIDPSPEVEVGDVRGRVLDPLGRPLSDVAVTIDDQSTVTSRQGTFLLPTPAAGPYDISIEVQGGQVATYLGMSRRNPVFVLQTYAGETTDHASLTVRLPSDDVADTDVQTVYFFELDEGGRTIPYENEIEASNASTTTHSLAWATRGPVHLRGYAFRYVVDPETREPLSYLKQASLDRMIAAGETLTWDVTWSAFTMGEQTLEAGIVVPSEHALDHLEVSVRLRPSSVPLPVFATYARALGATFVLPALPRAYWDVSLVAMRETSVVVQTLRDATSYPAPVELVATAASLPLIPEQGSVVTADTMLTWDNPEGVPCVITLRASTEDAPLHEVFVRGDSLSLPEALTRLVQPGEALDITWSVAAYDVGSVDDLAKASARDRYHRARSISQSATQTFVLERDAESPGQSD